MEIWPFRKSFFRPKDLKNTPDSPKETADVLSKAPTPTNRDFQVLLPDKVEFISDRLGLRFCVKYKIFLSAEDVNTLLPKPGR